MANEWTTLAPGDWCVIAADDLGVTIEAKGPDGVALADKMAAAAQQEFEMWPGLDPIVYMLVPPDQGRDALAAERLPAPTRGVKDAPPPPVP